MLISPTFFLAFEFVEWAENDGARSAVIQNTSSPSVKPHLERRQ